MDFYKNGVDASWWKNHYMSNSMFIHDQKEDFVAGYDHGEEMDALCDWCRSRAEAEVWS